MYTFSMNTPEGQPWIDPKGSIIPAYKRKAENRNFLVETSSPASLQALKPIPVQENTQDRVSELPPLEAEFHNVSAPYPNLRYIAPNRCYFAKLPI